jgi:4-amino-4-deoxy-L-arabinose transferase-like glycosyltransferase
MRFVPVRAAILGIIVAAIVTLPGLSDGTLWDNSETVYGEVAREVLLTHDWVVMHLNGAEWFVQPPLFFWIAAICAKIFGVSTFALRLPAALATIAMSGATGYATARIAGTRAGVVAAIVLSTSLMQAIVGRLAIMDALLDLTVAIAILCWFRALQRHAPPDGLRRATAFTCGTIAIAFGTLAKGPVAPVIVVLVIAAWLIWERRSGAPIALPAPLTLLVSAVAYVAIVAPWFVLEAQRVGPDAVRELIGHYTVGRYTGIIENQTGPWWYYIPVLILGVFPWIAFVPVAVVRVTDIARTRDGSIERLALTWAVVPLVFFSMAQTKLPNYIALMLPAVAIVVALWFERLVDAPKRRAAIVSAATIPLFIALLGVAMTVFIHNNHFENATAIVGPQAEILGVVMLVGSLITVATIVVSRWVALAPYALGVTSAVLVLFIALFAEPAAEALKPIPPLAAAIDAQRAPGSTVAIRGAAGSYALIFYTTPIVQNIDDVEDSAFVQAICTERDVFLVTRVADLDKLTQLVTAHGRRIAEIRRAGKLNALHIDGPPCRAGSGAPVSHDP